MGGPGGLTHAFERLVLAIYRDICRHICLVILTKCLTLYTNALLCASVLLVQCLKSAKYDLKIKFLVRGYLLTHKYI